MQLCRLEMSSRFTEHARKKAFSRLLDDRRHPLGSLLPKCRVNRKASSLPMLMQVLPQGDVSEEISELKTRQCENFSSLVLSKMPK